MQGSAQEEDSCKEILFYKLYFLNFINTKPALCEKASLCGSQSWKKVDNSACQSAWVKKPCDVVETADQVVRNFVFGMSNLLLPPSVLDDLW